MSGKWMAAIAAGAVLFLAVGPARAELLTYQFGGQITSINDPGGVWTGKLQVGDPFTGRYVIDSATPDISASPTVGRYPSTDAVMVVALGGIEVAVPSTASELTVWDKPGYWDGIDFSGAMFTSGSWHGDELFASARDTSCTAFNADALPIQVFDMRRFDDRPFGFSGTYGSSQRFVLSGTVSYLTVPEPGAFATAIMTLLVLGRRRAA